MKRIICCLLSFVIISIAAFAEAENNRVPSVQHIINEAYLNDWTTILKLEEPLGPDNKNSNNTMESLLSDNPPDIYAIYGSEFSDCLMGDFCTPFMPSDKMLNDIEAMPPIVQQILKESIYTKDGKLYAYPEYVDMSPMLFWVPNAWESSPFRGMTPPASYVELLDFLEIYLDTPHEGYCFYYDINESTNPPKDWIQLLIRCWVIQRRYNQQPIDLNNPEFISLLKRTVELSNRLYKVEPNKKKQKGRQLFTQYYSGYTTNGQDQYSWNNMIPWRITLNQFPLINMSIKLFCVRKGSLYSDRATELFNCIVDHRQDQRNGKTNYVKLICINKDMINVSEQNKQILKEYGANWKCLFISQEYVDSIWGIEENGVPCMIDDDYLHNVPWETEKKCYNLMTACASENMTAEAFTSEMDRLVLNEK